MIIGVTGPSGAGKSTFSSFLKEKGFYVLDADKIVHMLYEQNYELLCEIKKNFPTVFHDEKLNRQKLSKIVFSNFDRLKKLTFIVEPFVLKFFKKELEKNGDKDVVIDAVRLFESGLFKFCNKTVAVISDEKLRINRIIKRDNILKEMAKKRIYSQPDDIYYIKKANFIVKNVLDLKILKKRLEEILEEILYF